MTQQARQVTGNGASDLLLCAMTPNQLSHAGQSCLILLVILQGRYSHPHSFTDEATKTQGMSITCLWSHRRQSLGSHPVLWDQACRHSVCWLCSGPCAGAPWPLLLSPSVSFSTKQNLALIDYTVPMRQGQGKTDKARLCLQTTSKFGFKTEFQRKGSPDC